MRKILILLVLGFVGIESLQAQQDPHYTQYMYNQSVFNPAYAGSKESTSLGILYRKQWVGLEGAPNTLTLFGHGKVGKKLGVGVSAISDRIGPVRENNIYADVSYTVHLGGKHQLAFGVKGGLSLLQNNLRSEIFDHVQHANDPAFAKDSNSSFFNFGAGVFYYTDKYYVGLSVPNFLKNTYLQDDGRKFGSEVMHTFLSGGYVFDLDEQWKLKPSTMIKLAAGAPVSIDGSLNLLWNNKLEFGLSYRLDDSFSAMVNYAIMSNLRIGYAYDYITSDLRKSTSGSHEIILLFDIFSKRKVSSSPRYF